MFRAYLGDGRALRASCFVGPLVSTPATSRSSVDADGYYWFVGRNDDLIKSAGHLIGPFEVESVLMTHPAVAEAGVIGLPDPTTMGEMVKAFVSCWPARAHEGTEELRAGTHRVHMPGADSGCRRWRPGRSWSFATPAHTPDPARSCGGSSRPGSWDLDEGDLSTLEAPNPGPADPADGAPEPGWAANTGGSGP